MLSLFFKPKSITVIGASANKKKLGYSLVKNLIEGGFSGKIYPVNLHAKKILGLKVFKSILEVKAKIDLSIIAIPAPAVPLVLEQCGKKKIRNVIIISAGFKEIGQKGAVLEKQIKNIADKYQIKILGPNCLGILSSADKLNASFAKGMIKRGNIAFLSQSGAICTSLLDWATCYEVGFSRFISLGNKTVLNEIDFLNYLKTDQKTKVIFAYLEEVSSPLKFLPLTSKIAKTKPIFILKPGVNKKAIEAISSHTGALAQEKKIIRAAFRQAGVIQLDNLQQLFNLTKFYNHYQGLKGPRVAIITNAGGPGVIAVDKAEDAGLTITSISKKVENILKKKLPPSANIKNPIDVIGDADAQRYEIAVKNVSRDTQVDAILVILTPQTVTQIMGTAQVIAKHAKQKPILVSFIGGKSIKEGKNFLIKNKIPFFEFPIQAIETLAKVWQAELAKTKTTFQKYPQITHSIGANKKAKQLDFFAASKILKKYQFPIIESIQIKSYQEAQKQAFLLGFPVVLKINSEKIIHKTEKGAVVTRLITNQAIKEAFLNLKNKFPKEEIIIQPQPNGAELLLGFRRDAQFGPIFAFGLGGIYTEIFQDIALRVGFLNRAEALAMIKETNVYKILTGYRNYIKVNLNYLVNLILKMVKLAHNHPEILEFDINPLIVNKNFAKIVDIRIITTN